MGVKWLLRWVPARGAVASAKDMEILTSAVEKMHATSDQRGAQRPQEASCCVLRQTTPADNTLATNQNGMKDVTLLRLLEAGDSSYLLLRQEHLCLEASSNILPFLERNLSYTIKAAFNFQARRYRVGDFGVKMILATQATQQGSRYLGTALELDYLPLADLDAAGTVLSELTDLLNAAVPPGVAGRLERVTPAFEKYGQLAGLKFGHMHTAIMYTDLAAALSGRGR